MLGWNIAVKNLKSVFGNSLFGNSLLCQYRRVRGERFPRSVFLDFADECGTFPGIRGLPPVSMTCEK